MKNSVSVWFLDNGRSNYTVEDKSLFYIFDDSIKSIVRIKNNSKI